MKKILLTLTLIAAAFSVMAAGVPKYKATSGATLVATGPCTVESVNVASTTGDALMLVYDAATAASITAAKLRMAVSITAGTTNLTVPVNGRFGSGVVVSTAGDTDTVTSYTVVKPYGSEGTISYSSVLGGRVLFSKPTTLTRLGVTNCNGSDTISVYDSTTVAGISSSNLVAKVPVTTAILNQSYLEGLQFKNGVVVVTADASATTTVWAVGSLLR